VARTLVNIMTNDTKSSYGTAGRFFTDWYAEGGSEVAAKTGTNNSSKFDPVKKKTVDDEGNSALWFVGITPDLVSAAALVNPESPNRRISNVPGVTDSTTGDISGTDTFGATASKFWKLAYGPTLQTKQWEWPTVDSTPGNPVPSVTGMSQDEAIKFLASQGFVGKPLPVPCGSREQPGDVAFFSPKIAEPGATISLCISTGVAPEVYVPPVYTYTPPPAYNPPSDTGGGSSAPTTAAPAPSSSSAKPQPSQPKPQPKPSKSKPKPSPKGH
jgi:membrane peptidoglycan carboxypeptidase